MSAGRICKNMISRVKSGLSTSPVTAGAVIKAKRVRRILSDKFIYNRTLWEVSEQDRNFQEKYDFACTPLFSILVPLYNTSREFLKDTLSSVLNQTYKNWELCLADGSDADHRYVGEYCRKLALADGRIRYKKLSENKGISENTNACAEMAGGDFIALFDHDDYLHPAALFEYAKAINEKNADFIYCDEDKFKSKNDRTFDPYFKPDFAPDNLRGNNYICHFTVFKRSLAAGESLFRSEFDGSQDHDLILRLTEKAKNIVHIPKILYHWRVSGASVASDPYAKPYTITAGIKAVDEQLVRLGLEGKAESTAFHPNFYRIRYRLTAQPLVSIIIPNKDHTAELDRLIRSITEKSTYKNYEIIIIENNSAPETFKYYETLESLDCVRVVAYKTDRFNYSAINNFGVSEAKGEYLLFLNNDTEVITPDWIEEMLMLAQRSDVGAVGAMLYYPNDTIQHAGVTLGIGDIAGHNFKYMPRGTGGYFGRAAIQQDVSAVTAACMMVKTSVFKETGGFDERFEVAFNDIDLCMKIRKAGYLICFTPFAELYHFESLSRGAENTPEKVKRFQSEIDRFKEKWQYLLDTGDPYYNPNLSLKSEDFRRK